MARRARRLGLVLGSGLLLGGLAAHLERGAPPELSAQARPIYRVPVTGTVELGLAPFIARSIREAERANARAVILDMDTPGGRVDAAEQIVDAIHESRVPVYTLVNPRAFSAGALIALATDSIFMRTGAVIGAATPVSGQTGERLPEKYVSAMRAEFRALAEEHGIDPRIAEGMVDEQVEIPGIKPRGQLLTLSTQEAVRLGVARAEVADWDALLATLGIRGAEVVATRVNWAEALVRFLSNPLVASLLMSLGMIGLVVELKTPHFGMAGLAGLTCLALFFGSHWLVGLAGWVEILLILAGLALIVIEIFFIPGFGLPGIVGMGALGVGFFLSLVSARPTTADLWQAAAGVGIGLLIFGSVLVAFLRHLPASRRFAGILHQQGTPSAAGFVSAPTREDLVGKSGVAASELRPVGVAEIGGERVDVTTEGDFVRAGTAITVVRAEPMRIVVRPVPSVEGE
jgi:membrane-bound serine protease (ClpP class)